MDVKVHVGNTTYIESLLLRHELDVALVEGPIQDTLHLHSEKWIEDQLCVISSVRPKHKTPVSLKSLSQKKWIMREAGSGTRSVFETVLKQKKIQLQSTLILGDTEAVKHGVEAGLGISCVSRCTVEREMESGTLFALPVNESLKRPFFLAKAKNQYTSKTTKILLSFLRSYPI